MTRVAILLLSTLLFSLPAIGQKSPPKSETIRIDPDKDAGFTYPYYLYIPAGVERDSDPPPVLVIPNNSGKINDDLEFHEKNVRLKMLQAAFVFGKLNVPIMMPVFPRPKTQWKIYTHALDRDTLLTDDTRFARTDKQLIAMHRSARTVMEKRSIATADRILLYGFSAAGMYANRFAFLHPEKVRAAAVGSPGGWPIAPVASYKKRKLRYPLGVGDFETVSGSRFDLEKVRKIRFFFFLGDKDDNDSLVFRDGYEKEDQDLAFELFGDTPVKRWPVISEIYKRQGLNATFKLYPDLGHRPSKEVVSDILEFLESESP